MLLCLLISYLDFTILSLSLSLFSFDQTIFNYGYFNHIYLYTQICLILIIITFWLEKHINTYDRHVTCFVICIWLWFRFKMPENSIPKEAAFQIINDELMLDGNPRLNLASFVTTWMEPECDKLIMASVNKNYVDMDEYPVTTELQASLFYFFKWFINKYLVTNELQKSLFYFLKWFTIEFLHTFN